MTKISKAVELKTVVSKMKVFDMSAPYTTRSLVTVDFEISNLLANYSSCKIDQNTQEVAHP